MAEASLLTQHHVAQVLGTARLRKLIAAGWLTPTERKASRILYRPSDIHAALRRLERQICPVNERESTRVLSYYVPREKKKTPSLEDLSLDFTGL